MKPRTYFCASCEAEFKIKHDMDEDYYEVQTCCFCGAEVETELDFEEDD
jgi:DNA-directed RNA polymerase subunit RPC12/RpoP